VDTTRRLQIGISGSYGGMNLGDEAILEGILGELRATLPAADVTVFSRNPADTLARHNVERAVPVHSPRQILDLMGRFDFAVGMRLHFLIFAAIRGTPFAALPYASKVTGLLEGLEMESPPLGSIGIGQLIATIDRSWDTRAQIRATINRRLPALRARAKQTNELLLGLLGKRTTGDADEVETTTHH
jgi:polysaccharide pyruvyl transferase WcaK-like protein